MMKKQRGRTSFPVIILFAVCIFILIHFISIDIIYANDPDHTELSKNNFDMVPFYWTVGIIGGCIALTLMYVSWRKYRAEEKKTVKKDANN